MRIVSFIHLMLLMTAILYTCLFQQEKFYTPHFLSTLSKSLESSFGESWGFGMYIIFVGLPFIGIFVFLILYIIRTFKLILNFFVSKYSYPDIPKSNFEEDGYYYTPSVKDEYNNKISRASSTFFPLYGNWNSHVGETAIIKIICIVAWLIFYIYFSHLVGEIILGVLSILFIYIVHLSFQSMKFRQLKSLGLLSIPIGVLERSGVRIDVAYKDYIKKKIVDDLPHLVIGQEFEVIINNCPRTDLEKNKVQIRNPNTPNYSALVQEFCFEDFSKSIKEAEKNNKRLVTKLVDILNDGIITIEMKYEEISKKGG